MTSRRPYLNQMCVCLKNGLRFWISTEQAGQISEMMYDEERKGDLFVRIDKTMVALSEIIGIFPPETIVDDQERRRGSWLCPKTGAWHERDTSCDCLEKIILPELGRKQLIGGIIKITKEENDKLKYSKNILEDLQRLRGNKTDYEAWSEMKRKQYGQTQTNNQDQIGEMDSDQTQKSLSQGN